jgi:uncharacterized membrane protein
MTHTALDNPQVRDYLTALDAALVALPDEQAGELREQISAHLEDWLDPDADEKEVVAVLSRLGSPADVVAEAGAETNRSDATAMVVYRRPFRLRRWSWRR